MASYIYTIFEMDPEIFENPTLVYASTKKWGAQKFLKAALAEGKSLNSYMVIRSRDSMEGTSTAIWVYDFMQIDPGELIEVSEE